MNRKYSLKKNEEIAKLVASRKSVGNKYYAIYYQKDEKTSIAISISKKVGCAVERNYQKRVIREILRKNLHMLEKLKMLIVIKKNSLDLDFQEKEKEIISLINKIYKKQE